MQALKLLVRIGSSLVLGWCLTIIAVWTAEFFGLEPSAFFNSDWVFLSLSIAIAVAY